MRDTCHTNVSFNSTSKMELYKIWDEDLKNKIKKRNRWEWGLGISVLCVVFGETVLFKTSFIGVALFSAVQLLKFFIEEAHCNYLMHKIDIEELNFKD